MAACDHPYCGEPVAFATMHGKQQAVAKAFALRMSAPVVVPAGIDTDAYGTFTGETPRSGTMIDAARAKAWLATDATGLRCGLGSEGSFGPHRSLPLVPGNTELLLFIDSERGIEVHESIVTHRTNFSSLVCEPDEDIGSFLRSIGFPKHGVVVTPHEPRAAANPVKGITCSTRLGISIRQAALSSADGRARITTDMRAHFNPSRMAVIRALAHRLAERLSKRCPACGTPGFGVADIVRGLPCACCGESVPIPVARICRCTTCEFELRTKMNGVPQAADPGRCPQCNP